MSDHIRNQTLQTAQKIINGDRRQSYGDASESFERIAAVWSEILGMTVTASQVALMMAGLKICRLTTDVEHEDSWIDLAGYAALGSEIALTQKKNREVSEAMK